MLIIDPQTASALCPGDRVMWYKEKGDRSQWTRGETIQGGQLVIFSDGNVTACYYSCINYITYRTVDTHTDTHRHTHTQTYVCMFEYANNDTSYTLSKEVGKQSSEVPMTFT